MESIIDETVFEDLKYEKVFEKLTKTFGVAYAVNEDEFKTFLNEKRSLELIENQGTVIYSEESYE